MWRLEVPESTEKGEKQQAADKTRMSSRQTTAGIRWADPNAECTSNRRRIQRLRSVRNDADELEKPLKTLRSKPDL